MSLLLPPPLPVSHTIVNVLADGECDHTSRSLQQLSCVLQSGVAQATTIDGQYDISRLQRSDANKGGAGEGEGEWGGADGEGNGEEQRERGMGRGGRGQRGEEIF